MNRVAAYWGVLETTTSVCPIKKRTCEDQDGECAHFHGYHKSRAFKGKGFPPPIGPVTVLCSAPTGKAKQREK